MYAAPESAGTVGVPDRDAISAELVNPFTVRLATNRIQFESAFRLIQSSYVTAGLAKPNAHGLRLTKYHLQDSTQVFVAELRGIMISTISLICDGPVGLPMDDTYGPELDKRRAAGLRLAEVSCLADRRKHMVRRIPVLMELFRWMVQFARVQQVDELMIAVHPKHKKFYERVLACEVIGDVRQYPSVLNNPAVPFCLNFAKIDRERPENYDRFFAVPLSLDELTPHRMAAADRAYFASLLQAQQRHEASDADSFQAEAGTVV